MIGKVSPFALLVSSHFLFIHIYAISSEGNRWPVISILINRREKTGVEKEEGTTRGDGIKEE